jgi:hypothetical protein
MAILSILIAGVGYAFVIYCLAHYSVMGFGIFALIGTAFLLQGIHYLRHEKIS